MTNQKALSEVLRKIDFYQAVQQCEDSTSEDLDRASESLKELYSERKNLQRAIRSEKLGGAQPWKIKQERFNRVALL